MGMELMRCYVCRKLLLKRHFLRDCKCKCGSARATWAAPSSLLETIQAAWWALIYREKVVIYE